MGTEQAHERRKLRGAGTLTLRARCRTAGRDEELSWLRREQDRLRLKGRRLRTRKNVDSDFPKNWVLVSLWSGVELDGPCPNNTRTCVVGERPSAPLGRNDRAVRERRPVWLARPPMPLGLFLLLRCARGGGGRRRVRSQLCGVRLARHSSGVVVQLPV
jgi:hypothetical protein